jgi:periplasmic divalent cation tolerance protein
MTEFILVLTNTPSPEEAQVIADTVVTSHLAAAVQIIGPVKSVYHWQGNLEKAEEWICLLKTSRELYPEVERTIQALHSYELPGILAIPIIAGSEPYLAWYQAQLKQAGE